jgi:hypothetical protein
VGIAGIPPQAMRNSPITTAKATIGRYLANLFIKVLLRIPD